MKKIIFLTTLFPLFALSAPALAQDYHFDTMLNGAQKDFGVTLDGESYTKVGQLNYKLCSHSRSSKNFCTKKNQSEIIKRSNAKPNFGTNSVLMRFIDAGAYTYIAYDKKNNRVNISPFAYKGDTASDNFKLVYAGNKRNQLCTTGTGTSLNTYVDSPSAAVFGYFPNLIDTDFGTDYCVQYNDNADSGDYGFYAWNEIDSTTKKPL